MPLTPGTHVGPYEILAMLGAGGIRQGATSRLFQIPPGVYLAGEVPGGQRFLTGSVKDATTLAWLEIVLGWPRLLGKQ